MALIYYYNNIPVDRNEVREKHALGVLSNFTNKNSSSIDFRNGTFRSSDPLSFVTPNSPAHVPIGFGKPILVEILCAYTGNAPKRLLGGKRDMLISSGVKSYGTFNASAQAINFLEEKVTDYQFIRPGGLKDGCPVVFYSPALDTDTLFLSYQLVAETFKKDILDQISNLFANAAGYPILATKAPYLLAGSVIIGIIGNIGKALFETSAFLKEDEEIRLDTSGIPISTAQHVLICNDGEETEFSSYKPGLIKKGDSYEAAMVHNQTGIQYEGWAPYIILNRDGKEKPDLSNYSAKLATASILEKYYGKGDSVAQTTVIIEDALKLYNDYHYHTKAIKLESDMKLMEDGSDEKKKAQEILTTYKKHIKNDLFKP